MGILLLIPSAWWLWLWLTQPAWHFRDEGIQSGESLLKWSTLKEVRIEISSGRRILVVRALENGVERTVRRPAAPIVARPDL
jgi:hypothetical protein